MEIWLSLMPMILEMIKQCQENRKRESIKNGLKNPGALEAWALRRVLRKEGYRRSELRNLVSEGLQLVASMSGAEIDELLDEAEEE